MDYKLLRIIFLLLFMYFPLCNESFAQRSKVLSKSPLTISLVEAIDILGKHYKVIFEYNDKLLANKKVELSALNKYNNLEKTLDFIIKPYAFKFEKFSEQSYLIYDPNAKKEVKNTLPEKKTISQSTGEIILKGKINDPELGVGLQGVSVVLKGTSKGTLTDSEGSFSINIPKSNTVLLISSIGYLKEEVIVNQQNFIQISLKIDNNPLSEVVVVGYGIQKKESLTSAIAVVGTEIFKDRAVSNTALELQGTTPGLTITRNSSRPGNEGLKIRIRGESSITDVDPLIVVDGVPTLGTWELNQLNSDDIASISVLKDASAAIYGARAAGGVILISTKRGKVGKMKLSYHSSLRSSSLARTTPIANMSEYAKLFLEASEQDGVGYYWIYDKESLEKMLVGKPFLWRNTSLGYDLAYEDNNWMNTLYGKAFSQQHNLSLSNASDKSNYRISLGYANNRGLLKPAYDGEKKYNLRVNYDYELSKKVKIETGISYDKREVSSPITGVGDGWYDPPIFPVYNFKGNWYDNFGFRNPVAKTTESGRITTTDDIIRLNLKLSAKLSKVLTFSTQLSNVNLRGWKKQYYQTYQLYNWIGDRITSVQNPDPTIQEDVYNTNYQNYGGFLDYKKAFANQHSLAVMLGTTTEINENKYLSGRRIRLLYPGLYDLNTADPTNASNAGGSSHWGLFSFVSRINYDYQEKYLLELTGRRDGSSRFASDFRWSNFGGISAGWIISKEKFMEEIPAISELKVRAGYGEKGGQSGIGLYDYLSIINSGTTIFGYPYTIQPTAYLSGMTSNTRTWERIGIANIGFDFGMINNKLIGTFDYFLKRNNGMLIDVTYPELLGTNAPKTNNGILSIKGWEFQVNWKDKIGDFAYNLSFNLSNNQNKLIAMEGKNSWNAGIVPQIQGYPLNAIFVYKTEGYFQSQEEVDAYYARLTAINSGELPMVGTQKLRAGDLKKADLDGNGYISATGNPNQRNGLTGDLQYIGDNAPHYTFGFNFGFTYKGFDFTSMFQGVGSQNMLRSGNLNAPFRTIYVNQNPNFLGNTWTVDNPNAMYPRLSLTTQRNAWNYNFTDIMVQKLRYARLKNMVLGYSFSNKMVKKIGLEKFRIYVAGNDLWEWTTIKDGFDPEFGENTNQTYPFARTWAVGLELNF